MTKKPKNFKFNKKQNLPLVLLDTMVVCPRIVLPLLLEKPESINALNYALGKDRLVVFMLKPNKPGNWRKAATVARVVQMLKLPEGGVKVILEGLTRVKINKVEKNNQGFLITESEIIEPIPVKKTKEIKALMQSISSQFREIIGLGRMVSVELLTKIFNTQDPEALVDLIAFSLDIEPDKQQIILEIIPIKNRLKKLNDILAKEIAVLKTGQRLQKQTAKKLGKKQKEIFLREQLKNIEEELGMHGEESEHAKIKIKIKKAKMPQETEKIALKELDRLKRLPSFSPETSYIRNYLDWLTELPWSKKSKGNGNIKKAEKILNKDHYGLDKIKQRVTEHLAVQKLVGKMTGPILCFIGPPGTGKTSIGKSIAKAMNRKFYRMSVGGVRDEAEIRGHRRTYVGALPGRIIQGIKKAKTNNPVFMLDEVDKIGKDFHGDPASALLEVLDPEQNNEFVDHYLDVPFDLSDVMFITTGNVLSTIPPALKDRMEIIRFPGYTIKEKFNIAKKFLFPKQIKKHGLNKKQISISDGALKKIIQGYTQESGVRNLERELAKICRKTARKIAQNDSKKESITVKNIEKILGPRKYDPVLAEKENEVGTATGLAWTQTGGKILFIEAIKMPGKGKLILTGSLGKVMKESAQAALSYAKAVCADNKSWEKHDIHLHVPTGAIPKDGPSAGIAMATALVSLLENKKINKEVAMTGEITLRGKVLEIGGVKEKVLAAHRSGIKTVILPKTDKKYIKDEIPADVRKKLKFVYVDHMDQVLKKAFV